MTASLARRAVLAALLLALGLPAYATAADAVAPATRTFYAPTAQLDVSQVRDLRGVDTSAW